MAITNTDAYANRAIATTDTIYVTDSDATTHKMLWSDVETFIDSAMTSLATNIEITTANTTAINVSVAQTDETGLDAACLFQHGTYSTALAYGTQTDHLVLKSTHITGATTAKYIMGDVNYITTSAASTGYMIVGYDYLSIGHDLGWSVARRSRVNITATSELGEIACVQASMEVTAGDITQDAASANLSGLYGRLEIDAAVTDVEHQACAIYADASYVGKDVTGETNGLKVYCGGATYIDYGIHVSMITNNCTAALHLQTGDSGIVPNGILFTAASGSFTNAFKFATATNCGYTAATGAVGNTVGKIAVDIAGTTRYIAVYDAVAAS